MLLERPVTVYANTSLATVVTSGHVDWSTLCSMRYWTVGVSPSEVVVHARSTVASVVVNGVVHWAGSAAVRRVVCATVPAASSRSERAVTRNTYDALLCSPVNVCDARPASSKAPPTATYWVCVASRNCSRYDSNPASPAASVQCTVTVSVPTLDTAPICRVGCTGSVRCVTIDIGSYTPPNVVRLTTVTVYMVLLSSSANSTRLASSTATETVLISSSSSERLIDTSYASTVALPSPASSSQVAIKPSIPSAAMVRCTADGAIGKVRLFRSESTFPISVTMTTRSSYDVCAARRENVYDASVASDTSTSANGSPVSTTRYPKFQCKTPD